MQEAAKEITVSLLIKPFILSHASATFAGHEGQHHWNSDGDKDISALALCT